MSGARVLRLATISFLALFAEVAFIRLLSSETRLFGFYKNLALISCFLGLGTGATLGSKGTLGRWFVPGLAAFGVLITLSAPHFIYLSPSSGDEFIWVPRATTNVDAFRFYVALAMLFSLNTFVFFAGGQAVGAAFEGLPPLRAYAANLLGSLAGTLAFTVASLLELGPVWWLSVIGTLGLATTWRDRRVRWGTAGMVAVALAFFGLFATPAIWSPYYKITTSPHLTPSGDVWGTSIDTNSTYHLKALDLSEQFMVAHPSLRDVGPAAYYGLPYHFVHAKKVLVLGAGAGNDVAAALRSGAESVTAVEIDPAITQLGREVHPEKPYDSPKVHVVVGDARAFLKNADSKYDLIVYGLLDSHTVVAAMSNVRLDNFMYTRESFERARSLLEPGGMVALSFSSGFGESWWILRRIGRMLERAFGEKPVVMDVGYDKGFVFLAGPGAPKELTNPVDQAKAASAEAKFERAELTGSEEELTDDWPFMYLKGKWIPLEYWFICGAVILFAALLTMRSVPGGLKALDGHFFFLGTGFLLVEVRNIAELALLFGSTWIVNAFVITGVLVMALLANLIAARWQVRTPLAFAALGAAVALSFFSPVRYLAGADPWVRAVAGTAILSLPFFFSGLVFSASFKRASSPAAAYGANLLGAVVGGVLEHASLSSGIRSLSAFALVIYGLAYLTLLRRQEVRSAL